MNYFYNTDIIFSLDFSFLSIGSERYGIYNNEIDKNLLFDNNPLTCTTFEGTNIEAEPEIFFILPYKGYTPLCRSIFYVKVTLELHDDGCLHDNTNVYVYPEADEISSEWRNIDGELTPCTRLAQSSEHNCEYLYSCNCVEFCTVVIRVYQEAQIIPDVCEINVYSS